MIPWLKRILYDESAFERYGRALVFGLGTALTMGVIPAGMLGYYGGPILQALALVIGAGDKTPDWVREAELVTKKTSSDLAVVVPEDAAKNAIEPLPAGSEKED